MQNLKRLLRLHTQQTINTGSCIEISAANRTHLTARRNPSQCLFFNENAGEFLASLQKRSALITEKVKDAWQTPHLSLWVCAPKPKTLAHICEQCTTLGVTHFKVIQSEFSQKNPINLERLQIICKEAVQQSERFTLPRISMGQDLRTEISNLSSPIAVALERSQGQMHYMPAHCDTILVGPEGGFCEKERLLMENAPQCIALSLGPAILKTETAAAALCIKAYRV